MILCVTYALHYTSNYKKNNLHLIVNKDLKRLFFKYNMIFFSQYFHNACTYYFYYVV